MPTNTADSTAKSDSNINAAITIIDAAKSAIEATASDTRFNVFEIWNVNEPRHSLIIHRLLCYNKNYFLPKFIDHINTLKNKNGNSLKLRPADFTDARVEREKKYEDSNGDMKIDLLIANRKSRKAIIIENKLKGAKDLLRQIPRYYDAVVDDGYKVVGIIYIPPNKEKKPTYAGWKDEDKKAINPKLRIFPGYDEQGPDLEKWLADCEALYSGDELSHADNQNVVAILTQYREHLRYKEDMYMDAMNDFYERLRAEKVSVARLSNERAMLNKFDKYLAERIFKEWKPRFSEIGLADDSKFEVKAKGKKPNKAWWAYFPGLRVSMNQGDEKANVFKVDIWVWGGIGEDYSYSVWIDAFQVNKNIFDLFIKKIRNKKYNYEDCDDWGDRCGSFEQLIPNGESLEADEQALSAYLTNLLKKLKPLKA